MIGVGTDSMIFEVVSGVVVRFWAASARSIPPMAHVIHSTAVVDHRCKFGEGVEIGPHCVLQGEVTLGDGVKLVSHVHINGPVSVGDRSMLFPGVCIGLPPQDFKFKIGDVTGGVVIGKDTFLREHVTIHAATKPDVPTSVGDRVMMMVNSHIGHDAKLGNGVILANGALLAGHSSMGDNSTMSGNSAMHQFTRVGRMAFISGLVAVAMDVPPFCLSGGRNQLNGINLVGMRRAGIERDQITAVREAYRMIFRRNLPRKEMIAELQRRGQDCPLILEQAEFVATAKRPIAHGRNFDDPNETEEGLGES